MKRINFIRLLIFLLWSFFHGSVWAEGGHGGGHHGGGHGGWHGGGHHGGHWEYGFGLGLGLGYGLGYYGMPYYPYPYYPYPPLVTAPARPIVYIQNGELPAPQPQTATQPQTYWHYCRNPDGYYPYVRDCPGGWERVSPQPPGQ